MNLRSNIKKVLRESTFFRRRVDMRLMEKEFFETLNYVTDGFIYKLKKGISFDFDAFKRRVISNIMDDYHNELSNGGSKDFPYDEVYDFLSNHFHDKIKERYDLILNRNINGSVPSQVKRRHQNFDDMFVAKRKRLICNYRTPEYLFNGLLESTLEDLYFSLFVDSVTYEEWEESVKYIEKYLTKKYYDETSKMWQTKCKGRLYESFTGDTPTDITKQFINKPVKLIGDVTTNTVIQNVKINSNGSVNVKFKNGMSVNSSLPMLRKFNVGVSIPLEFKVRKKTIVLESEQSTSKKINVAVNIIENEFSDIVRSVEVIEYFNTPTIIVKVDTDDGAGNVTVWITEEMINVVSEITSGKVKLDYWYTGDKNSEILLRVFKINPENNLTESEDVKEKDIEKNLRVIKKLINMFGYSEVCDMWVEYNPEDGYYEIKSKMATKNHNTKALEKEFQFLEDSLDSLKLTYLVFHPHWVEECEDDNKLNESEDKISSTLDQLVNMLFDGFDDIYYDWANYNCGMGECCDPYAIGFSLPNRDYDDYIFKLVNGDVYDDDGDYPKEFQDDLPEVCYESPDIKNPDFDTIVFYGLYAEEIEDFMGPESNWRSDLLKIINNQFGCDAKRIIII